MDLLANIHSLAIFLPDKMTHCGFKRLNLKDALGFFTLYAKQEEPFPFLKHTRPVAWRLSWKPQGGIPKMGQWFPCSGVLSAESQDVTLFAHPLQPRASHPAVHFRLSTLPSYQGPAGQFAHLIYWRENGLLKSTEKKKTVIKCQLSFLLGKKWKVVCSKGFKQIKAIIAGYLTIWPTVAFLGGIWNTSCVDKSGNVCCQEKQFNSFV